MGHPPEVTSAGARHDDLEATPVLPGRRVALALAAPAAAEPSAGPKALRKHSFPVRQGPLPASEKAAWTHAPYEAGDCSICHVSADRKKPGPLTTSGNQLCYSCHGEFEEIMRRPYKHPPAEESCLHCHNAHDSRERKLLHTGAGHRLQGLPPADQGDRRAVAGEARRPGAGREVRQLPQPARHLGGEAAHPAALRPVRELPRGGRHEGRPRDRPHQLQEVAGGEQGPARAGPGQGLLGLPPDARRGELPPAGRRVPGRLLLSVRPPELRALLRLPQREGGERAGDAHPHELPGRRPQPPLPAREQGRSRPDLPHLPRGARLPAGTPRPRRRPVRPPGLGPQDQLHADRHRRAVRQDLPRHEDLREG